MCIVNELNKDKKDFRFQFLSLAPCGLKTRCYRDTTEHGIPSYLM